MLSVNNVMYGIYYNKTLMEEHNWELPANFAELEALCAEIKEAGLEPGYIGTQLTGVPFATIFNLAKTGWFSTLEGVNWERQFLAGNATAAGAWEDTMDYVQRYIDIGMFNTDPEDHSDGNVLKNFVGARKAVFCTSMQAIASTQLENDDEIGIMPFISEDGNRNLYMYSPSCYIGISRRLTEPVIATLRHRSSAQMALQEQANRRQQEKLNARLEESNTLLAESKKTVERSLQIAEDASRAKSAFLSNMSHEIRTPINAVLGMNEMILRECSDKSILSYAANIQSSGKTLLFLINDVLDMSKIESGKMEIVPVEYETANLIIDLWNGIYLRARDKDLTVDFILDSTLPRMLLGDDMRVKQIVTNLLTNAVKYTSEGGIELHADYKRTEDGMIDFIISVKDTGMGIRQEDMGKLFESFQRIEEEKNRNIEGTGLGMNIVMSLLQLMGGDIKVDSEYQKGSTFTVTIPQKIISDEATGDFNSIMSKHRSASERSQESFEAPEANVLVVDDNSMNLDVFKALLKRTRMNIVMADSGRQCLELVKEQSFNIIFIDHMMPEMDGIETLHEMRKLGRFPNEHTPVIALTANIFFGGREAYLKEGFNDFLTKPIEADLLDQMILSYLPEELVQITKHTEVSPQQKNEMADEEKGKLTCLEEKGISTRDGLQYCSGDIEFYHSMLAKFAKDAEGKITNIRDAFQREDHKNYSIMVHALKSTSKTIGANTLSEMAKDMEYAAQKQDTAYIEKYHEALLTKYRETVQSLFDVLNLDVPVLSNENSQAGAEISKDELLNYLSELKKGLDTFEADKAETLLKEMDKFVYQGSSVSELLHDARQDVEDFELSAAAEKVEALMLRIEQ